jgi:CHAD domain-containing protein
MRFEFMPGERADAGTRRLAMGLIDHAILQTEDRGIDPADAIHEARKDMKKLRGLLRLVRPSAPKLYKVENRAYRDAAAELSALRDADVALETFDQVIETARSAGLICTSEADREHANPGTADTASLQRTGLDRDALARLRGQLEQYRTAAHERFGDPLARLDVFRLKLLDARERVPDWRLKPANTADSAFASFGPGLHKTYRRGRKAMIKAQAEPNVEAFHDWRKRVKYLTYHLRLLRPGWPKLLKAQRNEVKTLGDLLGDDHDLAVLAELLPNLDGGDAAHDADARQALLTEIGRQSEQLRRRAFGVGSVVYAESPKTIEQRFSAYWRQAEINAAEQQNAG